jgi:hypothetical protein
LLKINKRYDLNEVKASSVGMELGWRDTRAAKCSKVIKEIKR